MQLTVILTVAIATCAMALPASSSMEHPNQAAKASLEDVETAAWYGWDKRDVKLSQSEDRAKASLEDVETAAWYGWDKRELKLNQRSDDTKASLEDVETAAWYGWTK